MPTPGEPSAERDHDGIRPPEVAAEQYARPLRRKTPSRALPAEMFIVKKGVFQNLHRGGFPWTFSPSYCCCFFLFCFWHLSDSQIGSAPIEFTKVNKDGT